ncbi:MAG: carbohydrate kinase [Verrucomicrobiota bacterium]
MALLCFLLAPTDPAYTLSAMEKVICFGETMWDCLPKGLFLGGAPFNVACHLRRLGCRPAVFSAVGNDFLGDEAIERARISGLDTFFINKLSAFPTGVAKVNLDASGLASYTFPEPCAWDRIELKEGARKELSKAEAILFGSLAMRSESNADLLESILSETRALRIFDVNLRPPYHDRLSILTQAQQADVLKVNEDELSYLSNMAFTSDTLEEAIGAVASYTGVRKICVTLGAEGAVYFDGKQIITATAPMVTVRDTVGAGDAFTAAITAGLLRDEKPEVLLEQACKLGTYVASQDGALPPYDPNEIYP